MARHVPDRDPDDPAGAAALGRLRLAAGAGRRVRPGDLRAGPGAARAAGQAVDAAVDGRNPAQRRGARPTTRRSAPTRRACCRAHGGSPTTASSPSPTELPELERVALSARRVQLAESQLELGGSVAASDEVAARTAAGRGVTRRRAQTAGGSGCGGSAVRASESAAARASAAECAAAC